MDRVASLDERRTARDAERRRLCDLAGIAARNAAYLAERAAAELSADHYSAAACDLISAAASISDAANRLREYLDAAD